MQNGVQQMCREDGAGREESCALGGVAGESTADSANTPTWEGMQQHHAEIVKAYDQLDNKFHDRCIAELQTEVIRLQEIVERCRAVQLDCVNRSKDALARSKAIAYRKVADELERALR